jgi:cardiolipin synthase
MAFADVLEAGRLGLSAPASLLQGALGIPHSRLRPYRDALLSASDRDQMVLALRVAAQTAAKIASTQPVVEVAWTYPESTRPGLRTTGGVAQEIIAASRMSLLVVGYSVTVDPALTGLAARTVSALARAAERGVVVTAVLHREANRQALLQAWRGGVTPPSIFTWPVSDDEKAAIHAKLLIADRRDALITSANLTYHGFERNLEMGVRVTGHPAGEIHDRIHELIATGEVVRWPG